MTTAIRRSESLHHALAHHARELEPLVGALALGILVDLMPNGWTLRQIKTGPQSFVLEKDGVEFHFRPGVNAQNEYDHIVVKDRWMNGKVLSRLEGRVDVLRF